MVLRCGVRGLRGGRGWCEESVRVGFVNGCIPGDLQHYVYKCTVREKKAHTDPSQAVAPSHGGGRGGYMRKCVCERERDGACVCDLERLRLEMEKYPTDAEELDNKLKAS